MKKLPINSMAGLALLTGAVLALISPMALALGKSGLPEPGTGLAGNLLHMILGLLAVLAVIFAGAWLLRRSGQMQAGGQSALRIVGGLSLGPRERAVLVQIGDKQLLIGVAPGRVQTLHVLDQPLPQTQGQKLEGGSFAGRLTELLKQRGLS